MSRNDGLALMKMRVLGHRPTERKTRHLRENVLEFVLTRLVPGPTAGRLQRSECRFPVVLGVEKPSVHEVAVLRLAS
jgi:hypothetical protein